MAAKEEQMLAWAETDSLQTTVVRRLYIIAKYREMLFRKFLEARHSNFESGTPTKAIDLQILDILSDAHRIALEKLLKKMREHRLEWTRPCSSKLFEGANVQRGAVISRSHPTIKSTCWIRRLILIDGSWTIEGADRWVREFKTTTSCEQQQLYQRPFLDTFAPICIFVEPVQDLGSQPHIIKTWGWARVCVDIVQLNLFVIFFQLDQKDVFLHDMLEFRVESQFATLSTQFSELIPYINRGRDDKNGKVRSSRCSQPPHDHSRPGPGDSGRGRGSNSEPSRK
ncbi:hypothetical protein F511_16041 [Dorcoceras hygrometricum]|uniref:Uncharacterized protein n=1 Tax=Dorcoceras hygrometricum TaxID=472368 RepID=A0A2Z7B6P2_9LAMI|nr:hypothetical protein F511_16041 [Dorcoceras hygrometricum]